MHVNARDPWLDLSLYSGVIDAKASARLHLIQVASSYINYCASLLMTHLKWHPLSKSGLVRADCCMLVPLWFSASIYDLIKWLMQTESISVDATLIMVLKHACAEQSVCKCSSSSRECHKITNTSENVLSLRLHAWKMHNFSKA